LQNTSIIFFPPQINIHNNMSCLKQFNNFIKKSNFEFGHCCICNEKKIIHELIICDISNLNFELNHIKICSRWIQNFISNMISNSSQNNYWMTPSTCVQNWKDSCYQIKVFQLLNINFQHVKPIMFPWKVIKSQNLH